MKLLNLNICIKINNNDEVKKLIKNTNADIVCLQEVMNAIDDSCFEQYKSKNKLVEMEIYPNNHFAPIYVADKITKDGEIHCDFGGKAEQGSLILSKFSIIEGLNQFYYNEYRDSYDATFFKEQDWCRSIQNVILDINNKHLQIINVHGIWNIDKVGDERTIMQSKFILDKLRTDIPAIVLGDFNLLPNTESIKLLNEKLVNLIDKYNIKTTRPFSDNLDKGNIICDYIFVNDLVKVNNFEVINDNTSDHLPIILDFDII